MIRGLKEELGKNYKIMRGRIREDLEEELGKNCGRFKGRIREELEKI